MIPSFAARSVRTEFSAVVSTVRLHSSTLSVPPNGIHLSIPLLGNIACVQATHASIQMTRPRLAGLLIRVPVDRRPARTRHPDAVALDPAIEIAAVLVLLEEGLECVEEGHAALVEHALYSMTWSARPSTDGGIVRPRTLAVLRLITSSNLVGCSTGRSAGFAPLRILSTKYA